MLYKKFLPTKPLQKFIECLYIWESDTTQQMDFESPPSGLGAIVFNYGDTYCWSNGKHNNQVVPTAFISGQEIKNYSLHFNGKIGIAGIVLKPTTLYSLLGIPMYEFTNERAPLSTFYQSEPVLHKLSRIENHNDKIICLEEFISESLLKPSTEFPETETFANQIFDQKGQITIQELLETIPMSRRKFERKFLEEVGVSPKMYARIRRFGYTCSLMAGNRSADMMEALHKGGYYDQSHFIKDFKYFAGRTPGDYVKNNYELVNFLQDFKFIEQKIAFNQKAPK